MLHSLIHLYQCECIRVYGLLWPCQISIDFVLIWMPSTYMCIPLKCVCDLTFMEIYLAKNVHHHWYTEYISCVPYSFWCILKPDAFASPNMARKQQYWQNYSNGDDICRCRRANACNQYMYIFRMNGNRVLYYKHYIPSPIPLMTSFAWQPTERKPKCWWTFFFNILSNFFFLERWQLFTSTLRCEIR